MGAREEKGTLQVADGVGRTRSGASRTGAAPGRRFWGGPARWRDGTQPSAAEPERAAMNSALVALVPPNEMESEISGTGTGTFTFTFTGISNSGDRQH